MAGAGGVSEHEAFVEAVDWPRGLRMADDHAPQFRAVCSCGWRSEQYEHRGDAQMSAVGHAVGHPPRRKPKRRRETGFFG